MLKNMMEWLWDTAKEGQNDTKVYTAGAAIVWPLLMLATEHLIHVGDIWPVDRAWYYSMAVLAAFVWPLWLIQVPSMVVYLAGLRMLHWWYKS